MSLRHCIGVGALALLLGGPAGADEEDSFAPYTATVVQTTADVLSGPGEKMYATNRLGKGSKVTVVGKREGGWLAIEPPEGSFSWVNARFLQPSEDRRHAIVVSRAGAPVPILIGSRLVEDPPTVRGSELKPGTILWTSWQKMSTDEGYLVQVVPPPSEVRYIRADAVSTTPDAAAVAGAGSSSPAAGTSTDPRWQQAEQAQQAGRQAEAARLYRELGNDLLRTDREQADKAFRLANAQGPRPEGQLASQTRPAPGTGPASPLPGLPPGWSTTASGWVVSPPGRLTRADHRIDDQETYLLLNSQGIPIVYATARLGYTLNNYLDRNLELRGIRQWRDDLRTYHLTVMEVRMLP